MNIEKLLRERIRSQGKAKSTADNYLGWCKRYFAWCRSRSIGKETKAETAVESFLSYLANYEHVSANTQNQAFSALCYFYREIINRPLVNVSALRAKRPTRTRQICDESEVVEVFSRLNGLNLLACSLMYGSGLRIGELGCIRIKDISFERKQIHIWGAKGNKDRIVQFPKVMHEAVRRQVEATRVLWQSDVAEGRNGVSLPHAWGKKSSSSRTDFAWYYLFSAPGYSTCPDTGERYRHHRDASGYAKALKKAVRESGIGKRITAHCLRHSYCTHSLEGGAPIHFLKDLMGHESIETTETYMHVQKDRATSTKSPIENLKGLLASGPGVREKFQKQEVAAIKLRIHEG